jgi:hypothetical protein
MQRPPEYKLGSGATILPFPKEESSEQKFRNCDEFFFEKFWASSVIGYKLWVCEVGADFWSCSRWVPYSLFDFRSFNRGSRKDRWHNFEDTSYTRLGEWNTTPLGTLPILVLLGQVKKATQSRKRIIDCPIDQKANWIVLGILK